MSIINLPDFFVEAKKDYLYFDVLLKGTNISVRETLRQLSMGKSVEDLLEANAGMTIDHIHTCLRYAWELVGAIDFKKAVLAVNRVNKKRAKVLSNLDSLIADPSPLLKYFQQEPDKKSENDNHSANQDQI